MPAPVHTDSRGSPRGEQGRGHPQAPCPAVTHQDGAVGVQGDAAAACRAGGCVLHAVRAADRVEAPLGAVAPRIARQVVVAKARAGLGKRLMQVWTITHTKLMLTECGLGSAKPHGLGSAKPCLIAGVLPRSDSTTTPSLCSAWQSIPTTAGHQSHPLPTYLVPVLAFRVLATPWEGEREVPLDHRTLNREFRDLDQALRAHKELLPTFSCHSLDGVIPGLALA